VNFTEEDKIYCNDLKEGQYYMLSSFDTGILGWTCDLYENDKVIKRDIELNLDLEKYYKKDD